MRTRRGPRCPYVPGKTRMRRHMWTQVIGKLSVALTPLTNHFWNSAFQVTSRGLATPALRAGDRALTITFDFIDHQLVMQCSDGVTEWISLRPRTVAEFYSLVIDAMRRLGIEVRIWTKPVEVPDPIRFEADTVHHSYDAAYADAFWRAAQARQRAAIWMSWPASAVPLPALRASWRREPMDRCRFRTVLHAITRRRTRRSSL